MTQANNLPAIVEEMLLDAGRAQDAELRAALFALGSLALLPAPAPSGELAVLLAESGDGSAGGNGDAVGTLDGGSSETGQDELAQRRRLRDHRPTVVGLALIAGMGLGVGGVAASSTGPGHSGSFSVQHLLEDWAPAWSLPVPNAIGSVLPQHVPDGHDAEASVPGESQPGVSEEHDARSETLAFTHPSEEPPAASRAPEVPAPNTPGQGTRANVEGQGGGAPGNATGSGQGGAGAAGKENQGAGPGLPEQAGGQGAGGQGEANHVAGAVPGARAESVPGVLRQGANAAAAAVEAVPASTWLQRFTR